MNFTQLQDRKQNKIMPLLKWPGGKRKLIKYIEPLVPMKQGMYYEPFFGGGALFFALQPKKALVADNNHELINCYIQVRDRPEELIALLSKLKNSESEYYRIRKNIPLNKVESAVRLIYLSTLAFNGIHRQNLKGQFNVPYGYKTHLSTYNATKLMEASKALNSAEIVCGDFSESLSSVKCGDVVYLDPPYTVAHSNNGFIKYNAKIFSWDDQIRLAKLAGALKDRDCTVIISNADHPSIRDLYGDFKMLKITRASVIAASQKHRGNITECLFYNEI